MAKNILRTKYAIVPIPYVVELNQHPMGPALQGLLGQITGRFSVPNVMVNKKSIGGGDDMAALDKKGELKSTLKTIGGDSITEVKLRDGEK